MPRWCLQCLRYRFDQCTLREQKECLCNWLEFKSLRGTQGKYCGRGRARQTWRWCVEQEARQRGSVVAISRQPWVLCARATWRRVRSTATRARSVRSTDQHLTRVKLECLKYLNHIDFRCVLIKRVSLRTLAAVILLTDVSSKTTTGESSLRGIGWGKIRLMFSSMCLILTALVLRGRTPTKVAWASDSAELKKIEN